MMIQKDSSWGNMEQLNINKSMFFVETLQTYGRDYLREHDFKNKPRSCTAPLFLGIYRISPLIG